MIKILELATKVVENITKSAVSISELTSIKASTSLVEESSKIDTKALAQQVTHHKEVSKQLDKLFD